MNTEITNAINASKDKAQYDTHAKRLLSQKIILAHILVKVIDEFKDMKPEQVMAYIEGDPIIGTIPVDPGLTKIIINIVMIGIAKELPKHEEKYELHRLIAALLSNQLNEQQGIEDRAIAETTAKIILNMYHSGYSLAQIADAVEMTETEVLDIITSASA